MTAGEIRAVARILGESKPSTAISKIRVRDDLRRLKI
jgi:hypothetical protein